MKLSRAAWNNVIIISVMTMILLVNLTNDRLFVNEENGATSSGNLYVLGEHAVILSLAIENVVLIERVAQSWRSTPALLNEQAIEQMMMAWQQSEGLLQAANIEITGQIGVTVTAYLAGKPEAITLTLYPLDDQLLLHHQQQDVWLAMPLPLYHQLIPAELTLTDAI